ncbi:MAG: DUF3822 family protein [Culturomica sp.]|jgi:hypothetical protein|nr:DUF3822 family protein [Culturomica sp.]
MQRIYHLDPNFVKEKSTEYVLSIRFSTDGLSFCVHNGFNKLLALCFQPYSLDSQVEVIARVKKALVEEELLNLPYKKVFVVPCKKEKTLIPAHIFNKTYLSDVYRLCQHAEKNDTLLYRKIRPMEAYLVESLPRSFVTFLTARYQSLRIVNSAYPFIVHSLSSTLLNREHLFIDIQDRYFDLLLTKENEVLLFNTFAYGSLTDLVYYILNCLKSCNVNTANLQTVVSGNLANDPKLHRTLGAYIPEVSILNDASLAQLFKNSSSSRFIHLVNAHRCE